MKRRQKDALLTLVQSYFQEHLRRVRGASVHTMRAFQHALRLFFIFLAEQTGRPLDLLVLDDIRADRVLAFLDHVETARGNAVATRNYRLIAIRGFVSHLLRHDLARADQYHRILALPAKKTRPRVVTYLEPEEMRVLLAQPDQKTPAGARDHALLLFLYNTGARIAEALSVHVRDLQLIRPRVVRVLGKGGKERTCPLWPETAAALRPLLQGRSADDLVFQSARGHQLTRDGAAYLLEKYTARATKKLPNLSRRHVTPHVLRHSCAVALLQAGNDLTVVRDFLGHASIATTNIYVTTNLQMKREVLSKFWRRSGLEKTRRPPWRPTPKLLSFLTSLSRPNSPPADTSL